MASNLLTPKQQRFCDEYIVDLNATRAAKAAGYSARTAEAAASRLLRNVKVATEIGAALDARSKRTGVDAQWVLNRLHDEAEADIADLYDDDGNLKPIRQWPLIWRKGLVAGIETISVKGDDEDATDEREQQGHGGALKRSRKPKGRTVIHKIKLGDRARRVEMLGKHVKVNAFAELVNVTGLEGLAERLAKLPK